LAEAERVPVIRIQIDHQFPIKQLNGHEIIEDTTVATEVTAFNREEDSFILEGALIFSGFLRESHPIDEEILGHLHGDVLVSSQDERKGNEPIHSLHYRLPFQLRVPVQVQEKQFLNVYARMGQWELHIVEPGRVRVQAELLIYGFNGSAGYEFHCGNEKKEGAEAASGLDQLLDEVNESFKEQDVRRTEPAHQELSDPFSSWLAPTVSADRERKEEPAAYDEGEWMMKDEREPVSPLSAGDWRANAGETGETLRKPESLAGEEEETPPVEVYEFEHSLDEDSPAAETKKPVTEGKELKIIWGNKPESTENPDPISEWIKGQVKETRIPVSMEIFQAAEEETRVKEESVRMEPSAVPPDLPEDALDMQVRGEQENRRTQTDAVPPQEVEASHTDPKVPCERPTESDVSEPVATDHEEVVSETVAVDAETVVTEGAIRDEEPMIEAVLEPEPEQATYAANVGQVNNEPVAAEETVAESTLEKSASISIAVHDNELWKGWDLKEEKKFTLKFRIVQETDHLDSLAERYSCTVAEIMRVNGMTNEQIDSGQVLYIPTRRR
jgi:LysM repeat protein